VASGYTEIVITGVHVGEFGLDLPDGRRQLTDLIADVLEVPGLQRFRLSSIQPNTVTDGMIDLMATHPRFARHFHLPLQSGSDDVLRRMKRPYTAAEFDDVVHRIAERVPDCGIGTDVIAGFPGETDEDFQRTFDQLAETPLTYAHAFTYSRRPGSAAAEYGGEIPGDVSRRRTSALRKLSHDKNRAFRERLVGGVERVVLEGKRHPERARLFGLTGNFVKVDLGPGTSERTMVRARVVSVTDDGLAGEVVS
jgi:threonylcarbamoyladenosine tRNA methylthiotransferase MtaB